MAVVGPSRFPCHICLAEVDSKHSFALFSSSTLKEDWPRRASELLQLSVTDEEGLPRHLCKNCKAKVLSVEEKLQKIRTQAQHTLRLLEEKRSVRKRAKDTSSGIVSPHTAAVRPACHYQSSTSPTIQMLLPALRLPANSSQSIRRSRRIAFFPCAVSANCRQTTSPYGS